MQTSDTIDKIAPAFVKAQAECNGAKKSSNNPHFKSKYADLSAVWTACETALADNGLAVLQGLGEATGGAMHMDTVLMHDSGQWLQFHSSIPLPKGDPQGYGSATTYLRRYALAALMGVVQEDDDGNAATRGGNTGGGETVSDEQLSRLQDEADATGADLAKFCKYMGVNSLKEISANKFQVAFDALASKRRKEAA